MTMTTTLSAAKKTTSADFLPEPGPAVGARKMPLYRALWVQVLVAIAFAMVLGYLNPAHAVAMKPLGDAFIRAISMIVTLNIFCTVVTPSIPVVGMALILGIDRFLSMFRAVVNMIGNGVATLVFARWVNCQAKRCC
jgi:Na+/H+-dicarboxylate symporter